ncbi:MAG: hypothetical protein QNJ53_28895 [Pleurocapsa sp. MO_192.B19]|nr:hypothetical protein [Pleurocapsa sp. MO_192.B19]
MNNNRQKPTHPENTNVKKLPLLQPLKLQQLDGVWGGIKIDGSDERL